ITNQVLSKTYETKEIEDQLVNIAKIDVLVTNYDEPKNPGEEPPITLQKEWNCEYAREPYYFWLNECDLVPYQNFLVFYPLETDDTLRYFYNLKKTSTKEK